MGVDCQGASVVACQHQPEPSVTFISKYDDIYIVGMDPLTSKRAEWWEHRRQGMSLAEIGRLFGVTRQAVYLALRLADREMMKAFRQLAETYKVAQTKIDTGKGLLVGYSQALGSPVIMAYSPKRGIALWYKYEGQCQGCERWADCLKLALDEARRLGVEISPQEEDLPPAKLAEIVFRRAWPEVIE